MNYAGLTNLANQAMPHVGGNIREGDPYTFAPSVWNYVIERFCPKSVLDIGSGLGHASEFFHSKGLRVLAVEGDPSNVAGSMYPAIQFDLTRGAVNARVDLVHCQEVVEHIEERYLDNLLDSMCAGRYILMTNALPGQGGHHHVNEQPTEYWVKHLAMRGCRVLVEDTNRIRRLAAADGAIYLAQTGLLLANSNRAN
jgi:hypothetical protein